MNDSTNLYLIRELSAKLGVPVPEKLSELSPEELETLQSQLTDQYNETLVVNP